MHFRFGSLHRAARAAARVLPPFLVAVVVAIDYILAATRGLYNGYCAVDTLATIGLVLDASTYL